MQRPLSSSAAGADLHVSNGSLRPAGVAQVGNYFGELALSQEGGGVRTATIRAKTGGALCFRLDRKAFDTLTADTHTQFSSKKANYTFSSTSAEHADESSRARPRVEGSPPPPRQPTTRWQRAGSKVQAKIRLLSHLDTMMAEARDYLALDSPGQENQAVGFGHEPARDSSVKGAGGGALIEGADAAEVR